MQDVAAADRGLTRRLPAGRSAAGDLGTGLTSFVSMMDMTGSTPSRLRSPGRRPPKAIGERAAWVSGPCRRASMTMGTELVVFGAPVVLWWHLRGREELLPGTSVVASIPSWRLATRRSPR